MLIAQRLIVTTLVLATCAGGAYVDAQRPGGPDVAAAEARIAFEVVSIRPSDRSQMPAGLEGEDPCSQAMVRRRGNRLVGNTTTVYALIALAYNPWKLQCARVRTSELIVGGPTWIRSERFAIEALLPDGVDAPADEQLFAGGAPDLQRMLVAMLADRFKVKVHQEARDRPAYLLSVQDDIATARARIARAKVDGTGIPVRSAAERGIFSSSLRDRDGASYWSVAFVRQNMRDLAQKLIGPAQRMVVDRTRLSGEFDFVLEYDDAGVARPTVFTAVREQLGLQLTPARTPMDVLVVESAARPADN
jgi:uncharacterized protein (TIGR03435 family)